MNRRELLPGAAALPLASGPISNVRIALQQALLRTLESKDHCQMLILVELWIWRLLREIAAIKAANVKSAPLVCG